MSSSWQLALIFTFYIIFFVLFAFIYVLILRYFGLDTFRDMNPADPRVSTVWKIVTILDPIFCNLVPAFLFTWMVTMRPIIFLHLDKRIRWQQALFVTVIVLLAVPVAGILYDWNCTFGFATSSLQEADSLADTASVVEQMPHAGYLLFHLVFSVLIPAIARECFFRGYCSG
jgi:hypothetical protein